MYLPEKVLKLFHSSTEWYWMVIYYQSVCSKSSLQTLYRMPAESCPGFGAKSSSSFLDPAILEMFEHNAWYNMLQAFGPWIETNSFLFYCNKLRSRLMISRRDSEPEVQTLEPVRASFLVSWVKRFKLPIYSISLAYVHLAESYQKVFVCKILISIYRYWALND